MTCLETCQDWASKLQKLLAQRDNLLVPDNRERRFFFEPCKFNSWVFRVNLSFLRENASIQLNYEPLLPSSHKLKLLTCLLLFQIISPDEWQAGVQVAYLNYGPVTLKLIAQLLYLKLNPRYQNCHPQMIMRNAYSASPVRKNSSLSVLWTSVRSPNDVIQKSLNNIHTKTKAN